MRHKAVPIRPAIAFHSVNAFGYPVPEFAIQLLNSSAIGVVGAALGIWLKGRYGRKARLKFGRDEVELEGYTAKEVTQVLERAAAFQASIKTGGREG